MAWTDTTNLVQVAGIARSADFNKVVDNLEYLYTTPQVAVRLTASQTVPDATDTALVWGEAVWDTASMWDVATPSKIVIPRDGVYSIVCSLLWDAGANGTKRAAFLNVTPSGAASERRRGVQIAAVDPTEMQLVAETNLAANDEIDIDVRHLEGADLNLLATRTVMTVRWVGSPPV